MRSEPEYLAKYFEGRGPTEKVMGNADYHPSPVVLICPFDSCKKSHPAPPPPRAPTTQAARRPPHRRLARRLARPSPSRQPHPPPPDLGEEEFFTRASIATSRYFFSPTRQLLAAPGSTSMLEDDDLLDGVPDDAPAVTDADLLDEDAGGKRGRQSGADADDAMEPAGLSQALEDDPPERAAAARKSGKRRIIQHVAKEGGAGGIDPHDPGAGGAEL